MREYVTALLLIVDYHKYTEDIVFVGISPYEGQRHIIVKKGANGTSKRGKLIDLGNMIKAKIYQRHHWYLSEAETVESFAFIKKDLQLIVLFQALLAVLKIAYVVPEKKLFHIVNSTLRELKELDSHERQELSLFFLIIRVLAFYSLIEFPFRSSISGKKIYEGYFNGVNFYATDEKPDTNVAYFSLTESRSRFNFLKFLLKNLLNIEFDYSPVAEKP
jgi:hypothetical protein